MILNICMKFQEDIFNGFHVKYSHTFVTELLLTKFKGEELKPEDSGPVNAHLTSSPGIYFNAFIHVYSLRAGANNPLGTNFWCQQKALITLPIRSKFKKRNLILYTFLMILYMYIAPGQGQTNPWGKNFDVNRNALSF